MFDIERMKEMETMNKYVKILKYVIFVIGTVIILSVVFSGCDNLKCRPDARKGYIGIICGGGF